MPFIDRAIHLFALDRPLDSIQAHIVSTWVIHNPDYAVYVWMTPELLSDSIMPLQEAFGLWPQLANVAVDRSVDKETYWLHITAGGFIGSITLTIQSVWKLAAIPGTDSMFRKEMVHRRHQTAINIARVWALKQYGGIYFSWEIRPQPKLQNTYISAQRSILFNLEFGRGTEISNNILAAVKDSVAVERLATMLGFLYTNAPPPPRPLPADAPVLSLSSRIRRKFWGPPLEEAHFFVTGKLPVYAEEKQTGTVLIAEYLRSVGLDPEASPWSIDIPRTPRERDDREALQNAIAEVDEEDSRLAAGFAAKKSRDKWRRRYHDLSHLDPLVEGVESDFTPPPPVEKIISNDHVTHMTYSFRLRSRFGYEVVDLPGSDWDIV